MNIRLVPQTFLIVTVLGVTASNSQASLFFSENFNGPTLDPAWTQRGELTGHVGLNGEGQYVLSDQRDGMETALRRGTNGAPSSFSANLDISFAPLLDPNTQTDLNWRFFGPDGFVEVVINSFNSLRVFSNNAGSNVGGPLNITDSGFSDSDTLNLAMSYDLGSDTFDVTYGINGGEPTDLASYTGAGNFYSNFTDVRMFKFGDNAGPAMARIDAFHIVPEPTSVLALVLGLPALLLFRHKRIN